MSCSELEAGIQIPEPSPASPIYAMSVKAKKWLESTNAERVKISLEHNFGGLGKPRSREELILGICAMRKKASSGPMNAFVRQLKNMGIQVVIFEEKAILNDPVETWPRCHALIAFFSDGFPLDKAEKYGEMFQPFQVNQISAQHLLMDRRHVYTILKQCNVPVPSHIIMNRGPESPSGVPVCVTNESELEEFDDYIVVNGVRLNKPFVEKPVSGEDHNIYIYYPRHAGGGSKRLFRKVKDRSSEFYPDIDRIRRSGSYIYEEFLATEGTDVKVYNVTTDYAHAEARKSPVVDGKVIRDSTGRELRYPIILNNFEKELSIKVNVAFGQRICGFDLLRSNGKSYVCDVNGFSFVKKNEKYYKDAMSIVYNTITTAMGLTSDSWILPELPLPNPSTDSKGVHEEAGSGGGGGAAAGPHEELRCVIGVIRHGDRTPKQKLKMLVTGERFLSLFRKYGGDTDFSVRGSELKLKSSAQLSDILTATREILDIYDDITGAYDDSDCELENIDKLRQVKTVLEMHGTFKGINRKVQLKPTKWHSVSKSEQPMIVEAQLILKWGGVLTQTGRDQAELMGSSFRAQMYPGVDGLLRLHSTYRHDLKIYSSDEGRVQVTAAAFAKGLLDLDGHLTPILASLVRKSDEVNALLDDSSKAKRDLESTKQKLHSSLSDDELASNDNYIGSLKEAVNPAAAQSIDQALDLVKNPIKAMEYLQTNIKAFVIQLTDLLRRYESRYGLSSPKKSEVSDVGNYSTDDCRKMKFIASDGSLSDAVKSDKNGSYSTDTSSSKSGRSLSRCYSSESGISEGGSAAHSLGSRESELDVRQLLNKGEGALASGDMLHLGLARWKKLQKDFYQKKKKQFDLSKIPDIYDCAKYDVLHSPGLLKLKSKNLLKILHLSKALADIVVPQEYGISPEEKLSIGSKICNSLLRKVRADIQASVQACTAKDRKNQIQRQSSFASSRGEEEIGGSQEEERQNEEYNPETVHRLDPTFAESVGIKSRDRHVRTRLYFTSESHLHSVCNVLRYAGMSEQEGSEKGEEEGNETPDKTRIPQVDSSSLKKLSQCSEFGYLTHIVIRLFELKDLGSPSKASRLNPIRHHSSENLPSASSKDTPPLNYPSRFRISVSVSGGVVLDKILNQQEQDEVFRKYLHIDETDFELDHETSYSKRKIETDYKNSNGSDAINSNTDGEAKVDSSGDGSISRFSARANLQLEPCKRMIPMWKNLEASKFDRLLHFATSG